MSALLAAAIVAAAAAAIIATRPSHARRDPVPPVPRRAMAQLLERLARDEASTDEPTT